MTEKQGPPSDWVGKHVEIYLREKRIDTTLELDYFVGTLVQVTEDGYVIRQTDEYTHRLVFVLRERVSYLAYPLEEKDE